MELEERGVQASDFTHTHFNVLQFFYFLFNKGVMLGGAAFKQTDWLVQSHLEGKWRSSQWTHFSNSL